MVNFRGAREISIITEKDQAIPGAKEIFASRSCLTSLLDTDRRNEKRSQDSLQYSPELKDNNSSGEDYSKMSVFEIAGIILPVIPLVLEGLESYPLRNDHETFKSFRRAKQERMNFAQELRQVNRELRCLMIDVITKNVSLTSDQRQVLTARNSGAAKFFDVWNEIVKTNSHVLNNAFEETMEDIKNVVEHLQEVLREILQHPSHTGRELLREIIENGRDNPTYSIRKNFSRRFKFARPSLRRHKLLEELRNDIKDLQSVNKELEKPTQFLATGQSIISERSYAPFLDTVRHYSYRLYNTLSKLWSCSCHKSLIAMLRLERRENPETNESNGLRFSLIFTFEHSSPTHHELWAYQETEVSINRKFVLSKFMILM